MLPRSSADEEALNTKTKLDLLLIMFVKRFLLN
nr:MAG TPA: hypothetical protein [Caudoviricetes sp.]